MQMPSAPTLQPEPLLSSRANPRIKQLRAAFAGQARLSAGLIAIEGIHLIDEALRSGILFKTLFLDEHTPIPSAFPRNIEVLRLTRDLFVSLVETQSPQGIAALILPPVRTLDSALTGTPLLLIAAALQDPGNLGTLIRSAEAFGATGLLTTPNTVSPWNQKSLRATSGSIFRLPLLQTTPEQLATLKSHGIRLLAAVAPGHNTTPAHLADLTSPCALLIGNEGAGLSPELLALTDARITIPCPGPVESLNAAIAASILLYEASRQRAASEHHP